jgi:hypothetical protein
VLIDYLDHVGAGVMATILKAVIPIVELDMKREEEERIRAIDPHYLHDLQEPDPGFKIDDRGPYREFYCRKCTLEFRFRGPDALQRVIREKCRPDLICPTCKGRFHSHPEREEHIERVHAGGVLNEERTYAEYPRRLYG